MEETEIQKLIRETASGVEKRLAATLGSVIEGAIKPLNDIEKKYLTQKIEDLSQDLNKLTNVLSEISNTFLGLWIIKKIKRRLYKEEQKKIKEEQKNAGKNT